MHREKYNKHLANSIRNKTLQIGVWDQEGVGCGTLGSLLLNYPETASASGTREEWYVGAGDPSVRRRQRELKEF